MDGIRRSGDAGVVHHAGAAAVVAALVVVAVGAGLRLPVAAVWPWALAAAVLCGAVLVLVAARASARAGRVRRARRVLGAEGVAVTELDPHGTVRVHSEEWSAEALGEPIHAGDQVLVMEEAGLRLKVTRL